MSLKTEGDAGELPEELVITLRKPVTLGPLEYKEIRLREPLAGEYAEFMKKSGVPRTLAAISMIAGVPAGAAGKFGARDLTAARAYIDAFVESGGHKADAGLEEFDMPLRRPVEHAGAVIASLQLREPIGEDLIEIYSKVGVEQTICGLARISGVPAAAIAKIGVRDLNRGEAFLLGFMNGGQ
jgi:hypothetical protein